MKWWYDSDLPYFQTIPIAYDQTAALAANG